MSRIDCLKIILRDTTHSGYFLGNIGGTFRAKLVVGGGGVPVFGSISDDEKSICFVTVFQQITQALLLIRRYPCGSDTERY
ncbi:MAG: hypothetical protein P1U87_00090 [Verrucomicrobiales bacterium]|nr:hypothetical protein [Verrucomicrobiales bacterium]